MHPFTETTQGQRRISACAYVSGCTCNHAGTGVSSGWDPSSEVAVARGWVGLGDQGTRRSECRLLPECIFWAHSSDCAKLVQHFAAFAEWSLDEAWRLEELRVVWNFIALPLPQRQGLLSILLTSKGRFFVSAMVWMITSIVCGRWRANQKGSGRARAWMQPCRHRVCLIEARLHLNNPFCRRVMPRTSLLRTPSSARQLQLPTSTLAYPRKPTSRALRNSYQCLHDLWEISHVRSA